MISAAGPEVEIGPLERRDLRAVMVNDARVYPKPWSRKLWLAELERGSRIYRVARIGRAVVGHVGVLLAGDDAHVMTVVTDPDHQRRHVASRLLLDVIPRAIDAGCTALTLEVRAGNVGAQALYRRFGLAPVGVRRGYYEPEGEDALVMWAHDIDGDDYQQRLARLHETMEIAA